MHGLLGGNIVIFGKDVTFHRKKSGSRFHFFGFRLFEGPDWTFSFVWLDSFVFFFTSNLLFLLTGGVWKGEELLALEDRTVDRWRNLDITPNLERCRKSFLVDLKVIEGGGGKYTLGWCQASQYHGRRPLSISGRPKISRSHLFKRIILLTGRYWKGRATPKKNPFHSP